MRRPAPAAMRYVSTAYPERTSKLPRYWARSEPNAAAESPWRRSSGSGIIPM